jgi:hypothetical protein
MLGGDGRRAREVRDRARDLQHPVVAARREAEPRHRRAVADRAAHPLVAFPDAGVRQPDGRERGQPARHVDLDADPRRFDTDERGRQHTGEHGAIVAGGAATVNVPVLWRRESDTSSLQWRWAAMAGRDDNLLQCSGHAAGASAHRALD